MAKKENHNNECCSHKNKEEHTHNSNCNHKKEVEHVHNEECSHEHENKECCSNSKDDHNHERVSITSNLGCSCHDHSKKESKNSKMIFIIRLVVSMLVVLVMYILSNFIDINIYVQYAIYSACLLLSGYEILLTSIKNLFKLKLFDENFLMSVAAIGAFAIGEMPEAIFVVVFFGVGELFQDKAVNKSKQSIEELMNIDV
ncbi:MAG: hypothetical protein ACRC5M_00845, partial [Anaeroplasmataceae bacterium]